MKDFKRLIVKSGYDQKTWVLILSMAFFVGGVFGYVYEVLFYLLESGTLQNRGTTFGPWIPIYGFGALGIIAMTFRFRKRPYMVFMLSMLVTGALEYLTGLFLFSIGGFRLWDYNVEKWNWGNIDGYICLRSVLFFGLSGMILIYLILPLIKLLYEKLKFKIFLLLAVIPASLFLLDFIVSSILLWIPKV